MMRAKTRHLLAFCHFMNITCHGYLRGYIEAHPEIAFNEDMPSGFMQRVLRTRSPASVIDNILKHRYRCRS